MQASQGRTNLTVSWVRLVLISGIFQRPTEGISRQVYINPCERPREHPSHGHCQRPEQRVVSGSGCQGRRATGVGETVRLTLR